MTPVEVVPLGQRLVRVFLSLILVAGPILGAFALGTYYKQHGYAVLIPVLTVALLYAWIALDDGEE